MKFKTKGFTSLLLSCSFAVAAFSGVILYMTPRGRVANWTGWTMLGLDKHSWGALHINACLLFLIIAIVHLFLNWRVFMSYIKKKSVSGLNLKLEMTVAVLLTACLVAGTLWNVPPLTAPVTLNEKIKNYWDQGAAQGPAPHAEEFTVERFASTIGLTTDDVVNSLTQAGYDVEDTSVTIGSLAEDNDVVPSQIFAAVRKSYPGVATALSGGGRGMGQGMGQGRGRGMGQGMSGQGGGCSEGHADSGEGAQSGCSGAEGGDGACGQDHAGNVAGSCEAGAAESHGEGQPGMGPGQGMGGGMGRGMGQGMGRGMGGGMGPGWWRDQQEQDGDDTDSDQPDEDDDTTKEPLASR